MRCALALVLVCVPVKDALVCKQQPDTSINSYERLAEAIAHEHEGLGAVSTAELMVLLKETNRRLDALEKGKRK